MCLFSQNEFSKQNASLQKTYRVLSNNASNVLTQWLSCCGRTLTFLGM